MKRADNDLFVIGCIAVVAALLATILTFPFPAGLREEVEDEGPWMAKLPASDTVSLVDGKAIFAKNCVACHGEEGRKPIIGVPTLNQPRMLSVAADDYYKTIITHGRPGSAMPAWESMFSPNQIQSLVAYIRSWYPTEPDRSMISAAAGNAMYGASMYRNNCAGCHGQNGEGGIGNSLRSPSFLAMASEAFLRETIIEGRGRGNTAMPTGYTYSPEELSDVLAYLQTWKQADHSYEDVLALRAQANGDSAVFGAGIYRARCAACHGDEGEGGIGSRLNSESFLSAIDDHFLYRSITEGRPGTAMPSWGFLKAEDVADLISHLRSWQRGPSRTLASRNRDGDPDRGGEIYAAVCLACHGDRGQGGLGGQLANSVFLDCADDDFLWDTIAHGKSGTAMRGFLKGTPGGALVELGPEDIDDLVAYLHALETEQHMAPPKRPLSRRAELVGKMVYEEIGGCAACHGAFGEGGTGPALRNPEFLRVASDGFLIGTIVLGREQSPMLSFSHGGVSDLSADHIESVVS
ncbi:MAG: c-type cytochrome, partial [Planctomycetota bacterium]